MRRITSKIEQLSALAANTHRPCTDSGKGRVKRKRYVHPMKRSGKT